MEIYKIVSHILRELAGKVATGVALLELNQYGKELMDKFGVESADYLYKPDTAPIPFPGYICTSVNSTIAHGVPTQYRLREGDIINLDVGIKKNGQCADAAFTLPVGEIAGRDRHLLRYAKRALYAGIERIRADIAVAEIGAAIESYAMAHGYVTNKNMSGHAIGAQMHMKPFIPSFHDSDAHFATYFNGALREGMIVCLEPMLTYGRDRAGVHGADGWTFTTADGKNSAMFEHMVRVEKSGYTILTDHFDETWFEKGGEYDY